MFRILKVEIYKNFFETLDFGSLAKKERKGHKSDRRKAKIAF